MTDGGGAGASCPACGASNGPAARFCGVCGTAMAATGPAPVPVPSEPHAMIGREIAGRYRVLGKLGEGGMGAVFRAEQISLKRTVAVKLLRPEMSADRTLVRRFNAEAEVVAKLSHPNTVNIYDFGQDSDGTLFIVMELIDGRSLRSVVQREAPLPLARALAIAAQIAASLADAHRLAIVHRDLKPDNVMLQDRGRERDVVRVLDFGIAKLRDDARATHQAMTRQGDMVGTPQYMAPEQIRGEPVDGRTDIYALGCLLYEMVTGRLPHEAPTVLAMLSKHLLEAPVPPAQRRPELGLPAAADALILGAMAKDPRARSETMDAFNEQIAALARDLTEPGGAPGRAAIPGSAPNTPGATPSVPVARPAGPAWTPVPPGPVAVTPAVGAAASVGGPSPIPRGVVAPGTAPPAAGAAPSTAGRRPARAGRRAALFAVAVLAIAGAAGAALLIAQGGRAAGPADASVARDAASAPDPWAPPVRPAPAADPWAAPARPGGDTVEIGHGVRLTAPPGFRVASQGGTATAVDARGIVIAGSPITISPAEARQWGEYYARASHLTLDTTRTIAVGGQDRPVAVCHGTMAGAEVVQIAALLVGDSYSVVIALQFPRALRDAAENSAEIERIATDVLTQRVALP